MKKSVKKVALTVATALTLLGIAMGASASPASHLRHINHRESRIVRHDTRQMMRAYRHGNKQRAAFLAKRMDRRVNHLNHARREVIRKHFV